MKSDTKNLSGGPGSGEILQLAFDLAPAPAQSAPLKGNDNSAPSPHPLDFFERYAEQIEPVPFSGCWLWTGTTMAGGYGWVRRQYTHRLAYEAAHGLGSARGWLVRHTCDVPCCVNPDHLLLGTIADNSRDMRERGRSLKGERQHQAKLTRLGISLVRALNAAQIPQGEIAQWFGISQSAVSYVSSGKRWGENSVPRERRMLRQWIKANSNDGCLRVLPNHLWAAERYPHSKAIRSIVAREVQRLRNIAPLQKAPL